MTKTTDKAENWLAENRLKLLCDLPDSEFLTGTNLSNAVKAAGYDGNARTVINDWNCWRISVQDFLSALHKSNRQPSEC